MPTVYVNYIVNKTLDLLVFLIPVYYQFPYKKTIYQKYKFC